MSSGRGNVVPLTGSVPRPNQISFLDANCGGVHAFVHQERRQMKTVTTFK